MQIFASTTNLQHCLLLRIMTIRRLPDARAKKESAACLREGATSAAPGAPGIQSKGGPVTTSRLADRPAQGYRPRCALEQRPLLRFGIHLDAIDDDSRSSQAPGFQCCDITVKTIANLAKILKSQVALAAFNSIKITSL
jgi:hypothetical protein